MAAGYSGQSAAQKLGVVEGSTLGLIDAPGGWLPEGLPDGVEVRRDLRGARDVTVAFVRTAAELRRGAARFDRGTADTSSLWIAWPRRAAGHESDVTENLLREVLLPLGLVDVKVAALEEDWSGLKFVRRKELRGRSARGVRGARGVVEGASARSGGGQPSQRSRRSRS